MAPLSLLLVGILLAVARVVEPLDCPTCLPASINCPPQTCANGQDRCMSMKIYQSLSIGKTLTSDSSRSCAAANKNVNGSFMFDFGDGIFLQYSSLLCTASCDGDANFNDVNLIHYWNGKYCPKCYRSGYTSCEDNGTVSCFGDYTQCAEISGKIEEGGFEIPFAAKGCAKGNLKELSSKLSLKIVAFNYNYTLDTLSYRVASGALAVMRRLTFSLNSKDLVSQVAFFLPCFLSLFAAKILS
ncbi:uncharacterized protein LOC103279323 [Anolis carolinensis]|uniref:uncharacterized protein LOC103279323 n=1 Tax=Anolis carolinensis TaxID=28377 RepID=UPI0007DB7ADE|nr:PREDICTED: uncharacterized protein LOC103279323 [Anolis carolinensis]|eukprot:XP_016850276.1 PREDICTED: uncharacterized protein LOC103279323 [Anolis carolinensis]